MSWPVRKAFAMPVLEGGSKERGSAFLLGLQMASSLAQSSPDGSMQSSSLSLPRAYYPDSNRVHMTWNAPSAYAPLEIVGAVGS